MTTPPPPYQIPASAYDDTATEAQWQSVIEDAALHYGWLAWHDRDSRKNDTGFPDLVCAHPDHGVAYFECKRARNPQRFTGAQQRWIYTLQEGGELAAMVQPRDWTWVDQVLRGAVTHLLPHMVLTLAQVEEAELYDMLHPQRRRKGARKEP